MVNTKASIALTGIGGEIGLQLAGFAVKFLGIARRFAFDRNIRPLLGVLSIHLQPLLKAWLGIRLDGICGAFRLTHATINAFVGVDHQHVFAFIEAVHRTNFHAIHVFALDAVFGDNVGHNGPNVRYTERN